MNFFWFYNLVKSKFFFLFLLLLFILIFSWSSHSNCLIISDLFLFVRLELIARLVITQWWQLLFSCKLWGQHCRRVLRLRKLLVLTLYGCEIIYKCLLSDLLLYQCFAGWTFLESLSTLSDLFGLLLLLRLRFLVHWWFRGVRGMRSNWLSCIW